MKNKFLLALRIFAVVISVFSLSYRLFISPLNGSGLSYGFFQLGFFSMQSSLFICIVFIFLLINQLRGKKKNWPTPAFRGAALLYGIITSTLFGAFFVGTFDAHGLSLIVLFINHILLTILIMVDNIISVPPESYKFDLLIYWMIYPFYYLLFSIFEGYVLNVNRYYFLVFDNVNTTFYPYILFLMALMFFMCAALIIFINKIFRKPEISKSELNKVLQDNER